MDSRILMPFAAGAILAFALGSSGAQSASTPVIVHGDRAASNALSAKPFTSPLSGEVFNASDVSVKNTTCSYYNLETVFNATGKAKGPYPGTFTASGSWKHQHNLTWSFNESFTITSGTSTISGTIVWGWLGKPPILITCSTFGPADANDKVTYSSGSWSGVVTAKGIKTSYLREKLL
jgi:hypothetical protein